MVQSQKTYIKTSLEKFHEHLDYQQNLCSAMLLWEPHISHCVGLNIGCENATTEEVWTTEFLGLQSDSNQKTHTEYIPNIKFRMLHLKCKIVYFAASVPSYHTHRNFMWKFIRHIHNTLYQKIIRIMAGTKT